MRTLRLGLMVWAMRHKQREEKIVSKEITMRNDIRSSCFVQALAFAAAFACLVSGNLLLPGSAAHAQVSRGAAVNVSQEEPRTDFISMNDRLNQLIRIITEGPLDVCEAAAEAIRHGMEVLYGGLRPLPTPGEVRAITIQADHAIARNEKIFAEALDQFILGDRCPDQAGEALDLKLMIEQINEVAVAVGRVTINCQEGKPCSDLVPFLDEETGHEIVRDPNQIVTVPFSLKLRSPFVPSNTTFRWQEHVVSTQPIPPSSCVAVFKETRGLMLRLRLVRIDVVRDPWATALLARGTKIPVWALEWVPSQYGKTWSICNVGGALKTTVTQRVKQDIPLNYFWRYYHK